MFNSCSKTSPSSLFSQKQVSLLQVSVVYSLLSSQSKLDSHPPHVALLQLLVTAIAPVVHESVTSLQLDVNTCLKSHVNGLTSGSFVQVPIPGILFPEQSTVVPATHIPLWQVS